MKNIVKILAVLTLIFALSATIFAIPSAVVTTDSAEESIFSEDLLADISADGTQQSPYEIRTVADFNKYANLIKSNNSVYGTKYYKLCGNIDFKNLSLVPFGTEEAPFNGTLDGNGYALLNTPVADAMYSGVIGYMTQGAVKNLRVSYADTSSHGKFSKLKYFGGIVGYSKVAASKTIEITGCETEGNIKLHTAAAAYMGGIVSYFKCESGSGYINNCVTDMSFDIKADGSGYIGGFGGYVIGSSNKSYFIKNCASFGNVNFETEWLEATVGGFVGYANKDEGGWSGWAGEEAVLAATDSNFQNCVTAASSVCGKARTNGYAGGFIGYKDGTGALTVTDCYKNNSASVNAVSKNVEKNTLATATSKDNLLSEDFYKEIDFDFNDSWYLSPSGLSLRNVAKSHGAGDTSEKKDIRLSSDPGLRFKATIESSKREYCFEYGFIIARKDELLGQELTFDFSGRKIWGVGFDSTTDKFIDKDDTTVTISGVVTGIPEEHYGTELVARTYVKFFSNGETVIVYSDPQTSSINLSAQAVRDSESYEFLTESQKELLETMLPKV